MCPEKNSLSRTGYPLHIHIPEKDRRRRIDCVSGRHRPRTLPTIQHVGKLNTLIEDEWYTEVIDVLRHPEKYQAGDPTTLERANNERLLRKAARFKLVEVAYMERNGKTSLCVPRKTVKWVLNHIHEQHGHYAAGICLQAAFGKFYWPTRRQDIRTHCASCWNCLNANETIPKASPDPNPGTI
ncbi:hypothetical protein VC83_03481 [Pseudogymnoascus destructans]|uniref:Integrase zinc-binding domain-containing protein n=1 Tax=Pseudogymnoascus destructans TaxID=655981 RepID=A0A177AHL9_9PEZI|nr:uncharacterized protein VC83_03481 [Pseudogymnoascus destructans]OAF60733.1 hypothetical protein VC83_03481 [Pseudogymnoascus destructans]